MSEIFVAGEGTALRSLERIDCRNESKELQDLLQHNHCLLPSAQIAPSDPPQWLLVSREMPVSDPGTGIATRTGPGLVALPLIANTDTATTGGTARTIRSARQPVVMSSFTCPQGDELSLKLVFWGEAENFGSGRTRSSTMTLTFTP